MKQKFLYEALTEKIIKCFYRVYDDLGQGFLESVYEKSLLIELRDSGLKAESQKSIEVTYKNKVVGEFIADIIVDDKGCFRSNTPA